MSEPIRHLLSAVLLAASVGLTPLGAQEPTPPPNLAWWHPAVAVGGVATLVLIDRPVRDFLQDHRSDGLDDVAGVTKRFKDPEVFAITGLGTIAVGAILERDDVILTGAHVLASYGLSSLMMIGTKWAFGRSRPSGTPDRPTNFDWFNGDGDSSFPSGSAAVVFSLATTVADAIERRSLSVVLYTGATLNAWARMNSDRHWLSDVTLGALYGITAAKLVNGEWTVFEIELPRVWTDGRSAGLEYTLRF